MSHNQSNNNNNSNNNNSMMLNNSCASSVASSSLSSCGQQSGVGKDASVLHVRNLDYKISADEWKRILLENFRKHCKEVSRCVRVLLRF